MRIRLVPDGLDKYKIILPGRNADYPIGVVWKDPFKKNKWCLKAYFSTLYKDEEVITKKYTDSMVAARELARIYNRIKKLSSKEVTDKIYQLEWPDVFGSD